MVTMACRREVERPPVVYARAVLGAGGATSPLDMTHLGASCKKARDPAGL